MGNWRCVALRNSDLSAKIDNDNFDKTTGYIWRYHNGYARALYYKSGKIKSLYMHHLVLQAHPKLVVDHINGNRLDNRRENLRIVSQSLNCLNSRCRPSNKTGYKGVWFVPRIHKWTSQITITGNKKHLGYFKSPEKAYIKYLETANKNGVKVCL